MFQSVRQMMNNVVTAAIRVRCDIKVPSHRTMTRSICPIVMKSLCVPVKLVGIERKVVGTERLVAEQVDYVNPVDYAEADLANPEFWRLFKDSRTSEELRKNLQSSTEEAPIVRAREWFNR